MNVVVVGGGYVAQLVQLAVPSARLLDWRPTPPKDHLETRRGPQYLWEPLAGIPNTEFDVITLVDGRIPTDEAILAYKMKIGKEKDGGDWGKQFAYKMKGYQAKLPVPTIEFNRRVVKVDLYEEELVLSTGERIHYEILVNTIPMDAFLQLTNIWGLEGNLELFVKKPIYMVHSLMPEPGIGSTMVLNYIADPLTDIYRVTTTGLSRFQETLVPWVGATRILPGKILPNEVAAPMRALLESLGCYCFGRFATWSPDELAHETWWEIQTWKERLRL